MNRMLIFLSLLFLSEGTEGNAVAD